MVVIPAEAGIQFFDVINKEKSLNLGIRNFRKTNNSFHKPSFSLTNNKMLL